MYDSNATIRSHKPVMSCADPKYGKMRRVVSGRASAVKI